MARTGDGHRVDTGDQAERVERLAGDLRDVAAELREQARRAGAATEVRWRSTAADRYRTVLSGQVARLREAADRADQVADLLRRHALGLRVQDALIREAAQAAAREARQVAAGAAAAAAAVLP